MTYQDYLEKIYYDPQVPELDALIGSQLGGFFTSKE
jgi:hypothetical protein